MIQQQVGSALNLWFRNGLDILESIENLEWEISIDQLSALLTYYFSPNQIFFMVNKSPNNLRRFIDSATFFEDASIEVYIRPDSIRYLKRIRYSKEDYMLRWLDFRKNTFVSELIQVLSHELLHREQWELGGVDDHRESIGKDNWDYLSESSEIKTHAQDAAFSIICYKEDVRKEFYVNLYRLTFGIDSPYFKRFLKSVYKFLEMMRKDQIGLLP